MKITEDVTNALSREDFVHTLNFLDECHHCTDSKAFHNVILEYANILEMEYVMYVHILTGYTRLEHVNPTNLSNPAAWMHEYAEKEYLENDPIRFEMEKRIAENASRFIVWDNYERTLSNIENEIIERRSAHGLQYGCSTFACSDAMESIFVISFSSKENKVTDRIEYLSLMIINQLNMTHKRLQLMEGINSLSKRQKSVAEWIVDGKTNWEIAKILDVTESTVKFHITNILKKLGISNRQQISSMLQASRYLSI